MAQMKEVFSSHIAKIGYDEETSSLLVEWQSGKTSEYAGVPPDLAAEGMNQASIGEWIHSEIKGKYPHRYV